MLVDYLEDHSRKGEYVDTVAYLLIYREFS